MGLQQRLEAHHQSVQILSTKGRREIAVGARVGDELVRALPRKVDGAGVVPGIERRVTGHGAQPGIARRLRHALRGEGTLEGRLHLAPRVVERTQGGLQADRGFEVAALREPAACLGGRVPHLFG